jgi:hypothetical protein
MSVFPKQEGNPGHSIIRVHHSWITVPHVSFPVSNFSKIMHMKRLLLPAVLLSSLFVCAQEHKLVKIWETDSILKTPESVLYDAGNKVLYVANIDGEPWGKDGKGSIGKVGLDGKIIAAEWVTGFNCAKGMGLHKGLLYVADFNCVKVVDTKKGALVDSIVIENAQGLNDVSVDEAGIIYVTDSKAKKLYRIENKKPVLLLDSLKGPNGILKCRDGLLLLDAGGMYRVNNDKTLFKIVEGMEGGTDGIENITGHDYIVSCWAGTIYYVEQDGTKQLLLDTRADKKNTADIGINAAAKIIYVPTFFKNTVVAYEVK